MYGYVFLTKKKKMVNNKPAEQRPISKPWKEKFEVLKVKRIVQKWMGKFFEDKNATLPTQLKLQEDEKPVHKTSVPTRIATPKNIV